MLGLEKVETWMPDGSCVEVEDPDIFFPNRDTEKKVPLAKAICAGCVVRVECLDYALRTPGCIGIWGGTTNTERADLRRRRERN